MSIYRMTLRFDLNRPEERQAVSFLRQLDRAQHLSRNRFVIDAVLKQVEAADNAGGNGLTLDQIRQVIREEFQNAERSGAFTL